MRTPPGENRYLADGGEMPREQAADDSSTDDADPFDHAPSFA